MTSPRRSAERILNRRLEANARGQSAFINAAVNASRSRNVANYHPAVGDRPRRQLAARR